MNLLICTLIAGLVLIASSPVAAEQRVDFNRDIRPILASNCLACHGRVKKDRQADLRLDDRTAAVESEAIVPGKPGESELVRRILSDDPEERMPPPKFGEALTAEQKEKLRLWIAAGAKYDHHWAFVAPTRPPLPKVTDGRWPRNGIDYFVLARLESAGRRPSREADVYSLVRRVYLDLIGLPPTPEEADGWTERLRKPDGAVNDAAYGQLVDHLLASKQYGERWARAWLDLARYADTNGYEKDRPRSIWPYRDWVIRALNDDMPFDQFSIEQLAGDMLPNATDSQRVATGFHRNTMLNEEGGIDPLEYRFYAMVDRVATTGTVWMGLTTGCAQCHSHKYDPISHADYYGLMALLNNADEPDLFVREPTTVQRRRQLQKQIADLEAGLIRRFPPGPGEGNEQDRRRKHFEKKFSEWVAQGRARANRWHVLRPVRLKSNLPKLEVLEDGSIFSSGDVTKRDVFTLTFQLDESANKKQLTALRLEVMADDRLPARGPGRAYYEGRKGDFFLSELSAQLDGQPVKFASATHSFGKIGIGSGNANATNVLDGEGSTGWSTAGREGQSHQLVVNFANPLPHRGVLKIEMLFERHFAASLGRFRLAATSAAGTPRANGLPVEIERLLAADWASLADLDRERLRQYYLGVAPQLAPARKQIDQLRKQMPSLPTTMVMLERPTDNMRPTHRHHRGEYLSPREAVSPALPSFLNAEGAAAKGARGTERPKGVTNRLALARWLVNRENPLVGRVTVNRAWQSMFGTGLVRTSSDLGTQSEPPSHPQLLDWLAMELMENGWSMKKLHRLIVTSATYRQSSHATGEQWRRDPANRELGRGPRFRVDAETVRDIMLKASGLLSDKMYGRSVYPPQPDSVTALAYGGSRWKVSTGTDRYRRSLYTFAKRTAPFAAFTVFDGPTGESCTARRDRSNTPLQALTLLNDNMYLEMARALEKNTRSGNAARDRATSIFRRLLTRPPSDDELGRIIKYQDAQRKRIEAGELDAKSLIAADEKAIADRAAWIMVARRPDECG